MIQNYITQIVDAIETFKNPTPTFGDSFWPYVVSFVVGSLTSILASWIIELIKEYRLELNEKKEYNDSINSLIKYLDGIHLDDEMYIQDNIDNIYKETEKVFSKCLKLHGNVDALLVAKGLILTTKMEIERSSEVLTSPSYWRKNKETYESNLKVAKDNLAVAKVK